MRYLLTLILVAGGMLGQETNVTDVHTTAKIALAANTFLLTLTSSAGTSCKLAKVSGSTISAVFACGSPDSKNVLRTAQIQATSTGPEVQILGQLPFSTTVGQGILCIIGLNPTSSPVTFGSVGTAPAVGISWSCSVDAVTIQTGTANWP